MIITTNRIAEAITVINQYAKLTFDFPDFYKLKNEVFKLLIIRGQAKKIGLDIYRYHYPKKGKKRIFTIIQIGDHYFHTTPTEADIRNLKLLNLRHRNPKAPMDLEDAKTIILTFLNSESIKKSSKQSKIKSKIQSNIYTKTPIKKLRVSHEMRGVSQWIER
ncbi:YkyB family protein [Fredinandcohnia sp. QZ13]|uniref:YkyB family protein n=1 Tax=Fredinandcohnia sp. QZ13 TaxID=3073144 RepID=UPI002852FD45|nr:YkyB family protein [Fredinandcohnia sp. QZ13]MDR4887971.1 YkyB family protein [Fredinandcohnia sp. QZ13]